MSSVYDASAIRAALPHVIRDLFNVNVFCMLRMKTENETDRKDSASQTKVPLKLGKGKISLILSPLVILEKT